MRPSLRTISALIALSSLLACSRSGRIPGDVIGREKMGRLLFEIGMAEGHAETYLYRDSARDKDSILRTELDRVLAIHGVSQEEFLHSYRFYKSRPSLLKVIVDSVQARSQREQYKIYKPRPNRAGMDTTAGKS